jgi:hypothetical protein
MWPLRKQKLILPNFSHNAGNYWLPTFFPCTHPEAKLDLWFSALHSNSQQIDAEIIQRFTNEWYIMWCYLRAEFFTYHTLPCRWTGLSRQKILQTTQSICSLLLQLGIAEPTRVVETQTNDKLFCALSFTYYITRNLITHKNAFDLEQPQRATTQQFHEQFKWNRDL